MRDRITSQTLLLGTALYFSAVMNVAFWRHVLEVYPVSAENAGFLISFIMGHTAFIALLFLLVCNRYTLKPVLVTLLILSSLCAYFMDCYDTVVDAGMLQNAAGTDMREAAGLASFQMLLYVLGLGMLPAVLVLRVHIVHQPWLRALRTRLLSVGAILTVCGVIFLLFGGFYSSFFREHKLIHHYSNPAGYLTAAFNWAKPYFKHKPGPLQTVGQGAHIPADDKDRELIIMVVGETTRADRFSLNGYRKPTNPLLAKEEVVSFTNVWSCGTSTIVSVPCMFSNLRQSDFDREVAAETENVMDVLKHAGVNTLWRDNNSSSKGVAERMDYQPFMAPDVNPVCDVECRDEGMLAGLQNYIDSHRSGDIMIVLHQMGSHGPAYYQRYPKEFEKFTPACHTNELKDCTLDEIGNAYDNTILYTDYFLSKVIALLKANDETFETAMLFVGDHGESLGENGLYLHGIPMMFAPDAQRHVPLIIWKGARLDHGASLRTLAARRDEPLTHEYIFHTLLGLMEIQTSAYDVRKDLLVK